MSRDLTKPRRLFAGRRPRRAAIRRGDSTALSRRTLLRGMLGGAAVSVGLPALELFLNTHGTAYADGTGLPKRWGLFFWGNGNLPERWIPEATGPDYALSEQLAPLAPIKDRFSVVSGVDIKLPNTSPHWAGICGILTGTPWDPQAEEGRMYAKTLDQYAADAIGGETRFRSVEVDPEGFALGYSFSGDNQKNPAEPSPKALYERLFGVGFALPGEDVEPDPRVGLRRSVLDAVMDQSRRLDGLVGHSDKIRLEQHYDSLRELELQLARLEEDPPQLEACDRPGEPAADFPVGDDGEPAVFARNRAFAELLAMTLACDQTRVVSNWFTKPVGGLLLPGHAAGHHNLTHNEPSPQDEVNACVKAIMGGFRDFIERLDAVPEGDGTLLDHMVVLGTSEVSVGRAHSTDEMPILVAGSCHGALKMGQHFRAGVGDNVSKVHLSTLRAAGANLPSWGEEQAYTEDGYSELEA